MSSPPSQSPSEASVVMVTGAYPPDVCGVGDYTDRLMAAAPMSWRAQIERDWSARAAPAIFRRLGRGRNRTAIIQYPTQGYGWSLVPHLLVLLGKMTGRYRTILALHEFGSLSGKARIALSVASHFAAHVIFTTDAERDRARSTRWFSRRVPTSVIGILSNIPRSVSLRPFRDRRIDVAYFGHIRPNKGIEAFLEVAAGLRRADAAIRLAMIGVVPQGYESYGAMVFERCRAIGCTLTTDLDDRAVGDTLADVRLLYLPFPDGVSARRGSVLAGLSNGAIVATSVGAATPTGLLPALLVCNGTPDDVRPLLDALRWTDPQAAVLQQAGSRYIDTMLPRDWAHVATLYGAVVTRASVV